MMYDRAAPASRTDFVLESIKDGILNGQLRPGQALVETELAAGLGVSKTPVREALKTLAGSGLVVMSTYKGAAVRVVDAELARSVYEVRALVEPDAVRRAVERRADFSDARAALVEPTGDDRAAMSQANRRFHRALYAGCGNPLMIDILDGLRDRAALITVAGWGVRQSWGAEATEHLTILTAAESGAAELAASLLRRHIETFAHHVSEELSNGA
jgi:DNA-binding GntR family transcriptional regulator